MAPVKEDMDGQSRPDPEARARHHEKLKARVKRMSHLHNNVCGCLVVCPALICTEVVRKHIRQLGSRVPSTPIKSIRGDRLGIVSPSCSLESAMQDISHLVTLHVGRCISCIVALEKATRLDQPCEYSQIASRRLSCRPYGLLRTNSCRSS